MDHQNRGLGGVEGLLHRLLPGRQHEFVFEALPPSSTRDAFEIAASGGRAVLRGTSETARASALFWYLTHAGGCDVFWEASQLGLASPLPAIEPTRRESPHQHRYYFNPCTFSYSTAFWNWDRWEREIDWMALHGITMPLALTGQEAVWQAVYRQLGLTDPEIDAFLVGPAYLPFGWMGCIDGWGGPLSPGWINAHAVLQQKIVARERELGMTPVLQGFTGHVPAALGRLFPESRLHTLTWLDFPSTSFLDPLDPLFVEIGRLFIQEQTRLYGTDHYYAADSFIEMDPSSNEPSFLANVARAIYGGMATADPEATWVMQGWAFHYRRHFWQPPQVRALLGAVPDDRMLLLDLWAEEHPVWQATDAFHGKPWLWCMLHNFGGRPGMCGQMPVVASQPAAVLAEESRGQYSGIGMVPEAIEQNPALYELMAEMTWHHQPVNLREWIRNYARRRYGAAEPLAEEAWQLLLETVYSWRGNGFDATVSVIGMRPDLARLDSPLASDPPFDRGQFRKAWQLLLAAGDHLHDVDTYQRDLVDVSQQALATVASSLCGEMAQACQAGLPDVFLEAGDRLLRLIGDLDTLVGTRGEYLLGRWIASARAWGGTAEERARLEWNARTLLTLWGPPGSQLNDYARRHWAGLLSGFYLPRWQAWIDAMHAALVTRQPIDADGVAAGLAAWKERWTRETSSFPTEPTGDAVAIARDLVARYADALQVAGEVGR